MGISLLSYPFLSQNNILNISLNNYYTEQRSKAADGIHASIQLPFYYYNSHLVLHNFYPPPPNPTFFPLPFLPTQQPTMINPFLQLPPLSVPPHPSLDPVPPQPTPKVSRRRKRTGLLQLSNRNILPNMTNVVLSYMRRVNRSGKAVQHALRRYYRENGYL